MKNKPVYILHLKEIDRGMEAVVGGKATGLGALSRIKNIRVPDGFCITTRAFQKIIAETQDLHPLLHRLSGLKISDRDIIISLTQEIRTIIENVSVPDNIVKEIEGAISCFGIHSAFAIRSSATAEDLPEASFAGQQDSFLNISGREKIFQHIRKCWASLFSERATLYRIQNSFDHQKVQLAVIVQQMIFAEAAGILFTADPLNFNRTIISVDAGFGLGEALVSGLVNPDTYRVKKGKIIEKKINLKTMAILPQSEGGTSHQTIHPKQQQDAVLSDQQILELEQIGREVEGHFGLPQDIEWCLSDQTFFIVQSRPITTLYPVPEIDDQENHVYVSVGHQQMMTDAMKPLGLSFYQLTAGQHLRPAGGRLFADMTQELSNPARREMMLEFLGKSDLLTRDALLTILERDDFIKTTSVGEEQTNAAGNKSDKRSLDFRAKIDNDPDLVPELISRNEKAIEHLKKEIASKSGTALFDFIVDDLLRMKKDLWDPRSFGAIMTGMNASAWINEKMEEWLGEKNLADTLAQSAPYNVTAKMGLDLLDVADAIRPFPEIIQFLQQTNDENFVEQLEQFEGGRHVRKVIEDFLVKYGMRCVGEIDISRPRWIEKPTALLPLILSNIKNFESGSAAKKFEDGLREALSTEQELLQRVKQLPDGETKASQTKEMIELIRSFAGYREYPKYSLMHRYLIYKQALIKEAEQLQKEGVIETVEDIFYLSFQELCELVRTKQLNKQLIIERKKAHLRHERLNPPRVITSDGEVLSGRYRRENLPKNAIAGLPVSSGIAEGRARVIFRLEDAKTEDGDILVTSFTDPGWTPLFLSIKGLVTEVGGVMTHGSVIAREYGLPAVVGIDNATKLIRDGQRIRVNGTDGYVELLDE